MRAFMVLLLKRSFQALGKELTVFHQILIDKVADAYVATLRIGDDTGITDSKKVKATAAELQKWLGMALQEERNAESATQAKRAFYEKVIGIVEDKVPDDTQRRDILKGIRDIVEE
jgi:hypothetical protein